MARSSIWKGWHSASHVRAKFLFSLAALVRGAILQVLVAAAFLAAASVSAAAIEPIKISRDDVALDLSGAVEIYRNQGENFQVSTAPGPDGIVRRIEVEANDARSTGDWARVRARQHRPTSSSTG